MNAKLQALKHSEMTRQEFITLAGIAVLSIFGLGPLLKFLFDFQPSRSAVKANVPTNYGH